jgi:Skp family chaperone for outer membrane proteins
LVLNQILARFQKAALLLGFVVIGAILPASVQAQETAAAPKSELKSSLGELSTLYQNEVQRLEKRVQDSSALYKDGLISRVQFEADEKALADARAKVEQIARDIALANQPAPSVTEDMIVAGVVSGVEHRKQQNRQPNPALRCAARCRPVFDLLSDVAGIEFRRGRHE